MFHLQRLSGLEAQAEGGKRLSVLRLDVGNMQLELIYVH